MFKKIFYIGLLVNTFSTLALAHPEDSQAEYILNWGETDFSQYFPSTVDTKSIDIETDHWNFRYYLETDNYTGYKDNEIYVLGSVFGGLSFVGSVGTLYETVANQVIDITNIILERKTTNCTDYVRKYQSSVTDINQNKVFTGSLTISVVNDKCVFTTNAIPNHDFNDGSQTFVTQVSEKNRTFSITNNPEQSANTTALTLNIDNAIFLNGVKLDLLAAACFGVADEKIGCFDINQPWRFDPMSPTNDFGTDSHNAHTQPDGTYHYHGSPLALFVMNDQQESPVIGFAADGFPIFGKGGIRFTPVTTTCCGTANRSLVIITLVSLY